MKNLIKSLMMIILISGGEFSYAYDFSINVNRDIDVPMPSKTYHQEGKAIFGDNSMLDYYQAPEHLRSLADSTVALVRKESLEYDYKNRVYRVAKEIKLSTNHLDDKEDFINQNILSFCSGAYVGNLLVITAGHCIETDPKEGSYYKNIYVVFGWRYDAENSPVMSFSEDQVYTIKEVKVRKLAMEDAESSTTTFLEQLLNNYHDYSLVLLDREPINRKPIIVDKNPQIKVGNKVFTIGYPLGMAVKIDKPEDAQIFLVGKNTFQTNIDAYGGNSGGPVFDSHTNKMIGILVTGFGGEFNYKLKQDVAFNIAITTTSPYIDLNTHTLYINLAVITKIKSEVIKKYNGKFIPNGNGKYLVILKAETEINNRDIMFLILGRLFGKDVLNKGKLVRYDQNDFGTGVMKIPSVILDQL